MQYACYTYPMANLQVRNIPTNIHERLRRRARENNSSMSAVVLTAVERELARWEWEEHLSHRPRTELGVEAATLLAEERSVRDLDTA